ncbi:Uncharacterised protein [Mycobacteroides abscessus subsp. abscessus]|nr:Uncharacterised protein [Mycobacteroides abscessus subsp. abscessus]
MPSSTRPARFTAPVASANASTSVVFPAPLWPTSATFRMRSGRSTVTTSTSTMARFLASTPRYIELPTTAGRTSRDRANSPGQAEIRPDHMLQPRPLAVQPTLPWKPT